MEGYEIFQQEREDNSQVECIYCNTMIDAGTNEFVPDVDDDDAWNELSEKHGLECEWIETRAHRIEGAIQ